MVVSFWGVLISTTQNQSTLHESGLLTHKDTMPMPLICDIYRDISLGQKTLFFRQAQPRQSYITNGLTILYSYQLDR